MKKNIVIIASLIIAAIDISFVAMNYWFSKQALKESVINDDKNLKDTFDILLAQSYTNMLTISTYIASDEKVQQLFLEGKKAVEYEGGGTGKDQAALARNKLYEHVGDKWKAVQKQFNTRQLHFHLGPGSTSFLRVHKPSKFGDNMDDIRHTIVDTNKYKTSRFGFETGRVYSGLRGVVPISAYDKGRNKTVHVGALEVGTSFEKVLENLNLVDGQGGGILLSKKHVANTMWPDFVESHFKNNLTTCHCYLEASTSDIIKDVASADSFKNTKFMDGGFKTIEVNDARYFVSYFPLIDYRGSTKATPEPVGAILFWRDANKQLANFEEAQLYNIVYGILAYLLVETILILSVWFSSKRLSQIVKQQTAKLAEQNAVISEREVKFRRLVEVTKENIFHYSHDTKGVFTYVSPSIEDVLGYSEEEFKKNCDDFLTDNLLNKEAMEKTKASMAGIKQASYELEMRHKNGELKTLRISEAPIFSESGNVIAVEGIAIDITAEKGYTDAVNREKRIYREMFKKNTAIKLLIDPKSGRIINANESAIEFYGYHRDKLLSMYISEINTLSPDQISQEMKRARSEERRFFKFKHKLASGDIRDVEIHSGPINVENAEYIYSIIFDVTQRNQYEKELQQTSRLLEDERTRLSDIIWATECGVWEYHIHRKKFKVNDLFFELSKIEPCDDKSLTLNQWTNLIHEDQRKLITEDLKSLIDGKNKQFVHEIQLNEKNNQKGWVLDRGKVIQRTSDGLPSVIAGIRMDISARKAYEKQISDFAKFDALTELQNRRSFDESLLYWRNLSDRSNTKFALMLLDLDDFKPINDTYGHQAGDHVLQVVAARFKDYSRETDIISRLGGDEFAIIIPNHTNEADQKIFAEKIIAEVIKEIPYENQNIHVGISIGCAAYQPNKMNSRELFSKADSALYQSKTEGKNRFTFNKS